MQNPIDSILRAASRGKEPLNILTFVTHERFEPNLCLTNHNFWSLYGQQTRGWNTKVSPIPKNYKILPMSNNMMWPDHIKFDLVLSQNKFGHIQIAKDLCKQMHLPLIHLEHTMPMPGWSPEHLNQLKSLTATETVFITEYSRDFWGYKEDEASVIEHMIDGEVFCPKNELKENYCLQVCNDFINRDLPCGYSVWERVTAGLPRKVLGDTAGLSNGCNSLEEMVCEFQKASIYINTSQYSPIPMSVLEAMACECAVVSSATCMIPEIIENGVNGFVSNDEKQLREYLQTLLHDPNLAREMGAKARETVLQRFSKDKFLNGWNQLFKKVANQAYINV